MEKKKKGRRRLWNRLGRADIKQLGDFETHAENEGARLSAVTGGVSNGKREKGSLKKKSE